MVQKLGFLIINVMVSHQSVLLGQLSLPFSLVIWLTPICLAKSRTTPWVTFLNSPDKVNHQLMCAASDQYIDY